MSIITNKRQQKPLKKHRKKKGKPRENNAHSRKSINTVAKPMNMWKNDGEKTQENGKPRKNLEERAQILKN